MTRFPHLITGIDWDFRVRLFKGWKVFVRKTHQLYRHDGLVIVGQFVVHRHDHAVCHDGDDDDPVEGRPVDQPGHHLPHRAGGSEEEERGGTSLVRLVLLLLPHPELLADCRGLQDSEFSSGQVRAAPLRPHWWWGEWEAVGGERRDYQIFVLALLWLTR